ncbi:MAG: ABC transporter permease [Bacteroidales bacterium]
MGSLKFLLEKEFKQILRNPIILPLIIILPTIQLAILPYAATYEIRNIDIAIVDADHSAFSYQLTKKIASSGYFQLESTSSTYQQTLDNLEKSKISLILEIPRGFEKDLRNGLHTKILISADAVDGTKASIGSSYLTTIIQNFSTQISKYLAFQGNNSLSHASIPQIELVPQYRYNPSLDYKTYMVPGILVMLLTLVGGILACLNIVSEREQGTLEQINVSPVRKSYYLLAKLIPFWTMGLIILTIGFIVARIMYHIIPEGNLFTIYIFATVYMIAFTGFGLLISASAKTQQQSMFIAFFFLLIFFLMGGLFTPISSMPIWAQYITYLNPTAYLTDVVRLVILKGSHFSDLLPQFFITCGFAVVFNFWAMITYRKID